MSKGNMIFKSTQQIISKARKGLKKNSPTILIIAGAVGVVSGVVLAAKAGKVVDEKTKKAKEDLEHVHSMKEKVSEETIVETVENEETVQYTYTKMDYAKDLTHAYANLLIVYAKVFGPAALTTLFSLFLIFSSHRILKDRYVTAYAGFATVSKAYDQYRKNVIEEEGAEADERYRFGIKAIDEEKPLFDKDGNPKLDKEGNQKKVKSRRYEAVNNSWDFRSILWAKETAPTAFDDSDCRSKIEEEERIQHNIDSITLAQNAANNKMKARAKDPFGDGIGYVTWKEVADMLGVVNIPKRMQKIAMDIIWQYDPRLDPESDDYDPTYVKPADWGDNKVDFGLKNPKAPGYNDRQLFMCGREEAVCLYMNYDGLTHDLW